MICALRSGSGILAVERLQALLSMGMFQIRVRVSNLSDRSRFLEENFGLVVHG